MGTGEHIMLGVTLRWISRTTRSRGRVEVLVVVSAVLKGMDCLVLGGWQDEGGDRRGVYLRGAQLYATFDISTWHCSRALGPDCYFFKFLLSFEKEITPNQEV